MHLPTAPGPRLALLAVAWAASATVSLSGSSSQVTVLDPVFVEASSTTGTPWQYLSTPGFEIISRCPYTFNAAFVRALEKSEAARLALLPAPFWGDIPTPIEIVLYDRAPENPDGIVATKPIDLSWSPEDSALVGASGMQLTHPVSVGDGSTFINCGNYWDIVSNGGDFSVDVDSQIRLSMRTPRFPSWFVEGLEGPCGLYSNRVVKTTATGDTLILTNALWTSSSETLALRADSMKRAKEGSPVPARTIMPLDELLGGHIPSGETGLWNAQVGLFVRWGLCRFPHRQAFLDFVLQATREPVTEPMFTKALGLSFAEAERQLADYLPEAASTSINIHLDIPAADSLSVRDASQLEVARIIGGWGRLEGRPSGSIPTAYEDECLAQASKLFEKSLARGPTEPNFLASFGLYALQVGDRARGTKALEDAIAAGVICPRAYVELARVRLEDALPYVSGGLGDLTPSQYNDIVGLLTVARHQMPSLASAYYLLERVMEHAPTRPERAELFALDDAMRLFPQDAVLAYHVATLYRRLGYDDDARAIVARATGFVETERGRALLLAYPAQTGR